MQSQLIPKKINKSTQLYPKKHVQKSLMQAHHVPTHLTSTVHHKEKCKINGSPFMVIPICILSGVVILGAILVSDGSERSPFSSMDFIGKSVLQSKIENTEWKRRMEDDDGNYYEVEIDFDSDTIDYYYDDGWLYEHSYLANSDYYIVDGHTINIDGRDVHITVNGNQMIISPAIFETNDSEIWYKE